MTIQEAIQIVSVEVQHPYSAKKMARPDALKLLIGAGERVLEGRGQGLRLYIDPLPGETEK